MRSCERSDCATPILFRLSYTSGRSSHASQRSQFSWACSSWAVGLFTPGSWRTMRRDCTDTQAAAYRWIQGLDSDMGIFVPRPRPPGTIIPEYVEYFRAMEQYHQGLRQKYEAATRQPWLPIPPDPPEPRKPDERLVSLMIKWRLFIDLARSLAGSAE